MQFGYSYLTSSVSNTSWQFNVRWCPLIYSAFTEAVSKPFLLSASLSVHCEGPLEIVCFNFPREVKLLLVLDQISHGFFWVSCENPGGWRLSLWRNSSMNSHVTVSSHWKRFSMGLVQTPLTRICVCCPLVIFSVLSEESLSLSSLWLPFKSNRLLIDYCLALPCPTELAQLPQLLLTAHWWHLLNAPVLEGPSPVYEHSLQTAGSKLGHRLQICPGHHSFHSWLKKIDSI